MTKQAQIMASLTDLFNKINAHYRPQMEAEFTNISLSEIETIEYIAKNPQVNVTRLAQHLYMTRGAASKITQKLLKKGLIERFQLPENKKEIYFRLTSEGQKINTRHENLHQKFSENDQIVFDQLTDESVSNILDFLEQYNAHLDQSIRKNLEK
ncbi:MarR family winged helix-turn-helix transcriptional regulator [Lactococcus kimchii]|uniref:MarR family winged helix-turn-helix transcriptional regulator n=1 Tax=Lactococcus sp. S-13 TaxID=2507158 RepID=UPI001022B0DE|nr:MarR family transcriptional regulator [Lactococcus sp. S-13]RZI49703.1 MarR family transcriptional regulator [Lactococcus sp. S-13]